MAGRTITRSQFAEATLELKGKPFGFGLHMPFRDIYNWPKDRILLKTARQVGKSTFLSASTLTSCAEKAHHRVFYASTSEKQAREFARVKLNELLMRSSRIRPILLDSSSGDVNNSVFEKQFSNGSGITVSYMKDNADRTRGYSADDLMLDEIQDMDSRELPVVEEVLSASLNPSRFYTGTPKTLDNHIEHVWQMSTKHEVFFKCKSCGRHNSIGLQNIGKKGPICSVCGGYLDIAGQHLWVPTYDKTGPEPYFLGARIPQPALLLHSGFEKKWEDLLYKYENYDESKFANEVLGLSHSTGTRFLTLDDIIESCEGDACLTMPTERTFRLYDLLVMGIDWSGDGISEVSKNAVVIFGRRAGDPKQRLQIVYKKIFPRGDMLKIVKEIAMIANLFKVRVVGADAGEGALNNSYLADALGAHRVQPFRYGSFTLPIKMSPDNRTVYLDKTSAIDDIMKHIKSKAFIFPPYDTFKEEASHILAEFEMVTNAGNKIYTHSPNDPDDFLHAMTFGYNAYKIAIGAVKFY